MKPAPPRLLAALAALLTGALLLTALDLYARHRLKHGAVELAALNLPENTRGIALQRELLRRPRSLLVYGSSELDIEQPTRADLFFHGHQRGEFQAFVIGQPGNRCLAMLQEIAALGEAARSRKVAIFLSPVWFLPPVTAPAEAHADHRQMAATFSPLQASRTLLAGALRPATRRAVAARLLGYENVVRARSPLLCTALAGWTAPSWQGRCGGGMVRPLLAAQAAVLAWQDRYHQLELLRARPRLRASAPVYTARHKFGGWQRLLGDFTRRPGKEEVPAAELAAPSDLRAGKAHRRDTPDPAPDRDEDFLGRMAASPEWTDLELLLRTLRELHVHALLINQPINGLLSDRQGVTPTARRRYYERVEALAARYRVPLRDFSACEEDPAFFRDAVHPSAKAWVFYDQALGEFYDGKQD